MGIDVAFKIFDVRRHQDRKKVRGEFHRSEKREKNY